MAISANLFLDRLADRNLLDDKVIAKIRKQIAARPITSTQLAKTLIEKGHLTTFQAKKLLADEEPSSGEGGPDSVAENLEASEKRSSASDQTIVGTKTATPSASGKAPTVISKTINDDLDLALSNSQVVDLVLVDDSSTSAKEPTFKLTPVPQPITPAPPNAPGKVDLFSGGGKSPPPPAPPVSQPPTGAPTQVEPVKGTFAPGPAPKETWRGVPEGSGSHSVRQTPPPSPAPYSPPPGMLTPDDGLLTPVDLLNDPLVTGAGVSGASAAPGLLQETKTKGVFVEKKAKGNRWEGFWIIGVAGLLISAVIAGVFILFVLKKGDATEMFQIAEDSYQSEQYAQAIEHYRRFLKSFPDDPNASRARVRIGIATLRQSLGGTRDFQRPLTVAGEVLPTIEGEDSFEDGRAELATLLPDIAAGFAAQGQAATEIADKQKFADLAMKAMDLVNESKYIPTRLREPQQARIDGILEDVALVRREIQREKDVGSPGTELEFAL